ncbi:MAG: hypothetical protein JWP91_2260 [Fibrobacteres bacterium]|nr:hypothetical protein [Fibrobacterota bacterium]
MRKPVLSAPSIFLFLIAFPAFALRSEGVRVPSRGPILSEYMADPAMVPDAHGEFLELGNPSADTLRLDSLRIDAEAQTLVVTGMILPPYGVLLICKDTVPGANGGMACDRPWGGLGLANGRAGAVTLSWNGGRDEYALPAPRPGVSWENTWEAVEAYHRFQSSVAAWNGGDSATPGIRNSRSALRPERDLGIVDVTWSPVADRGVGAKEAHPGSSEGYLLVRVANRGTGSPPTSRLTMGLDADWDGEAETPLDSAVLSMPAAGEALVRFGTGAGVRGIIHARLGRDEDPSNDAFLFALEPGRPLAFTEWRPAPEGGEPEWVEIRNRTADSGGIGRRLDLAQAVFNGLSLGSRAGGLEPGEFLVLTENVERFRSRYGAIKARILQPSGWRALRNTGDTLELSLAGIIVDRVAYGAVPGAASVASGAPTPGFAGEAVEEDSWNLSGRVAGPGRPLDVEVRTASGGAYALRIFDLEGNRVRDLGAGGPGRRLHAWDGRGDAGRRLNPGPYILCLTRNGGRTRRAAVVVMGAE